MRRPHIIAEIREALLHHIPDSIVILYGSEARGDARPNSDIDLLVLLPHDRITYSDRDKVIDALLDIELRYKVSISPYIVSKSQWENRPFETPFHRNVIQDGINLFIPGEYERRIG